MNTLVISYQYPLPEIGGNRIRTMNLVRYFRQCGNVDIVYFQACAASDRSGPYFRTETLIDISGATHKQSRIRDVFEKVRYAKPWIVCSFTRESVDDLVNLIEQGDYDYIVCRYAVSAYPLFFLSPVNRKKVIVDIDDLMTPDLYESVYGTLRGVRNIKSLIDMKMYRKFQKNCAQIGKALVCSEHDKELLSREVPSAEIFVVPNIAPEMTVPATYLSDGFDNIETLLFVGNLGYLPNVSGLIWFVETIFTKLLPEHPALKLLVVGKDPSPAIHKLCQEQAQIELVENPPDVLPFYERCGVVVVPLLSGGGTRIKILEAGLARRPVISTPIGAYGLSLRDRREIVLMDDYAGFNKQLAWLNNSANYALLTENMNRYVKRNFTVDSFECALDNVVGKIDVNASPRGTPGLVSVIVPVYNRENLVGRTIDSILAQSYPDIEVIAVNDGSSDASLAVLQVYADCYPGKIVLVDQLNAGQVRARNTGIQHSRGEYIAFLDSDDTWEPHKLAKQLPLFKGNVGLVYCGISEVDPEGRVLRTVPCEQGMNGNIYAKLLIKNRMTGGTVVVSRAALDTVGWFDETFQAAENWDLWIRIARSFAVEYVDEPLVNYLKHPGNMSCNSLKMSQASWIILQKHLPPSARKGELRQSFNHAYAHYYYNRAVESFGTGDYQHVRSAIFQCWRYRPFYRDSAFRLVRTLLGKQVNLLLSACKQKANQLVMQIKGRHDPASC